MLNAMFALIAICFFYHACKVVFSTPTEESDKSKAVTGETYFQFKKECKLRDCETEYDYNQL